MKIQFDEQTWSQLEEYLRVAQVCGSTANDLYSFSKSVAQRVVASLGSERDVSEEEAAHTMTILLTLRASAADAARGFAAAVERIDTLIDQVEPAAGSSSRRGRRSRPKAPKV